MLPFVDAAYTNGVEMVKFNSARLKISESSEGFIEELSSPFTVSPISSAKAVSLVYILFALYVEAMRQVNIQSLIREDLLDYIVMLHWRMDNGWHHQCHLVQKMVLEKTKLPMEPKQSSVTKAMLARNNREYSGQIRSV